MPASLDEEYLTWLYARTGSIRERRRNRTFWSLIRQLHETDFVWLIPNDDNRVEDGRDMRLDFLDEMEFSNIDPAWMDKPCSVLEVIFGLCKKLAFEAGRTPHYWFWELIGNLNLTQFNDGNYDAEQVAEIVDNLIWRTYSPDGHGGLFPLQVPYSDQRDLEIWDQLCAYVLERT